MGLGANCEKNVSVKCTMWLEKLKLLVDVYWESEKWSNT